MDTTAEQAALRGASRQFHLPSDPGVIQTGQKTDLAACGKCSAHEEEVMMCHLYVISHIGMDRLITWSEDHLHTLHHNWTSVLISVWWVCHASEFHDEGWSSNPVRICYWCEHSSLLNSTEWSSSLIWAFDVTALLPDYYLPQLSLQDIIWAVILCKPAEQPTTASVAPLDIAKETFPAVCGDQSWPSRTLTVCDPGNLNCYFKKRSNNNNTCKVAS